MQTRQFKSRRLPACLPVCLCPAYAAAAAAAADLRSDSERLQFPTSRGSSERQNRRKAHADSARAENTQASHNVHATAEEHKQSVHTYTHTM